MCLHCIAMPAISLMLQRNSKGYACCVFWARRLLCVAIYIRTVLPRPVSVHVWDVWMISEWQMIQCNGMNSTTPGLLCPSLYI